MSEENEHVETPVEAAPEVELSPVDLWVEQRQAELSESSTEPPGDTDTEAVEAAPEETATPEPEPEETGAFAPALRALLEQKDSFNKTKEEWLTEKAEHEKQIGTVRDQYKMLAEAKRLLSINPAAFFEGLGISKEDLPDIARKTYYEYLDEDAPDEYKATKANQHLYNEIDELKQLVHQQQENLTNSRHEKERAAFHSELTSYVKETVSSDNALATLVDVYSEATVAQGLYDIAAMAAQQPGATRILTAAECAELLCEQYKPLLGKIESKPAGTPEKPATPVRGNSAVMRNSDAQVAEVNPDLSEYARPDSDRADYERIASAARKRAGKIMDAYYKSGG